jgi:hypothetical protein
MGHEYRNIISANGGSGGPQMRLGGLIENSLIIEGYWFVSTESNSPVNPWMTDGGQSGQSAVVKNNVQIVYGYPTLADPDTPDESDVRSQPGSGFTLQGASFGTVTEGNIISSAMLSDELGEGESSGGFLRISPGRKTYQDDMKYTQKNNVLRNNIVYRGKQGLRLQEEWTDVEGNLIENNVFVASESINDSSSSLTGSDQLTVKDNRFYSDAPLPSQVDWLGAGNTLDPYAAAAASEGWPDPDRTLRRYVTEELGLTLLDWEDDPYLDDAQTSPRIAAGEEYDPTGMKTFMAVATNMRRGGAESIPTSGKPSWEGDYPWNERFTGKAVVNWIRAGFNRPAVD